MHVKSFMFENPLPSVCEVRTAPGKVFEFEYQHATFKTY
jgi:hypothetical protein